jgi:hypothetical protein
MQVFYRKLYARQNSKACPNGTGVSNLNKWSKTRESASQDTHGKAEKRIKRQDARNKMQQKEILVKTKENIDLAASLQN